MDLCAKCMVVTLVVWNGSIKGIDEFIQPIYVPGLHHCLTAWMMTTGDGNDATGSPIRRAALYITRNSTMYGYDSYSSRWTCPMNVGASLTTALSSAKKWLRSAMCGFSIRADPVAMGRRATLRPMPC